MWFDFLVIVTLFSVIGEEVARGGKVVTPTKTAWLLGLGIISFATPLVLDKFGLPHTHLMALIITLVIINIIFIVPAIAAQAIIATALSGFLLAVVIQFLPGFTPHNSQLYPIFRPAAHYAYIVLKPFVDKYMAFLKGKINGLKNIDPSKVKPTLPGKGTGGSVKPTLP